MKIPHCIKYLIRIWLTSVVLAPFVFIFAAMTYQYFKYGGFRFNVEDDIMGITFLILIGFLISLPTFFLMCLVIFKIDTLKRPQSKRLVTALLILFLICLTFWMGFNDDLTNGRGDYVQLAAIFGSYVVTSMASVFFYRVEKKPVPDDLKEFLQKKI